MDSIEFEGFIGANMNNASFSSDTLLLVVVVLLSAFAIIFRLNVSALGKMIQNIYTGEQRQSIFDSAERDRFLLFAFMTFQTLLLCAIFMFSIAKAYDYFFYPDIFTTLKATGLLLLVLFLFFVIKLLIISIFSVVFAENNAKGMILINYQYVFCVWGITLYFPVLWVLLIGRYLMVALVVFAVSYLVSRVILIYRFIYIFFNKNNGKLFLLSYLCAQEIIPLVFLYEGLIFMYHLFGVNNVWQ